MYVDESDAGSQRSTPVLTRNVWGGSISQNSFSSAGKEGLKYDNDDIDYDNDNDNNNDDDNDDENPNLFSRNSILRQILHCL